MAEVDLVINCFERSYRKVLSPGFFPGVVARTGFDFARRTVLINNVDRPEEVLELARTLQELGDVDEVVVVADHAATALDQVGLTATDLGRIPHYTDCAIVAVTLPHSPWLVYWDADVTLPAAHDWISPSLELMVRDPRILAASPNWTDPEQLTRECPETAGPFQLGLGFSDQLFLARRADLSGRIYSHRSAASRRYPMSHIAMIFEARVDAYMRTSGKLRAVLRDCQYQHVPRSPGPHVRPRTLAERLRKWRNRWFTPNH